MNKTTYKKKILRTLTSFIIIAIPFSMYSADNDLKAAVIKAAGLKEKKDKKLKDFRDDKTAYQKEPFRNHDFIVGGVGNSAKLSGYNFTALLSGTHNSLSLKGENISSIIRGANNVAYIKNEKAQGRYLETDISGTSNKISITSNGKPSNIEYPIHPIHMNFSGTASHIQVTLGSGKITSIEVNNERIRIDSNGNIIDQKLSTDKISGYSPYTIATVSLLAGGFLGYYLKK